MTAIPRLTFRQWSRCVDLGENGIKMMRAQRALRRNVVAVQQAILDKVMRDSARHGTGIMLVTTTGIERVPPHRFFPRPANDEAPDARQ